MSFAGFAAIALVALGLAAPVMLAGSAYKELEFSAVGRRAGETLGPLDQTIHVPGHLFSPKPDGKKPQFALHHPVPSIPRCQWPPVAQALYIKPTAVQRKGSPRPCSAGIYIYKAYRC